MCYNGSTCEASAKSPPSFADPFCDHPLRSVRIPGQLCVRAASVFCLVETRVRAPDTALGMPSMHRRLCSGCMRIRSAGMERVPYWRWVRRRRRTASPRPTRQDGHTRRPPRQELGRSSHTAASSPRWSRLKHHAAGEFRVHGPVNLAAGGTWIRVGTARRVSCGGWPKRR
jgi:hypothetical protein